MKTQYVHIWAHLSTRFPKRRSKWAIALAATAAALTIPVGASAQHYYANVFNDTIPAADAGQGISCNIDTGILSLVSCSDLIDHEMWYYTDADTYWVEVGVTTGYKAAGGCVSNAIFWADNRNGGGYHEHYPNVSWNKNTWYNQSIYLTTTCGWLVYFGGVNLGTSTSNCGAAYRRAEAGIEASSTAPGYIGAKGWTGNYVRLDSNSFSHNDWENPWLIPANPTDPPPDIQWMWGGTGTEEVLNNAW